MPIMRVAIASLTFVVEKRKKKYLDFLYTWSNFVYVSQESLQPKEKFERFSSLIPSTRLGHMQIKLVTSMITRIYVENKIVKCICFHDTLKISEKSRKANF